MFPTPRSDNLGYCPPIPVAIPSNRVNVSYIKGDENANSVRNLSQSPQIGSMFPTKMCTDRWKVRPIKSRNPLKSGQCFLQSGKKKKRIISFGAGRNPLKSGQCFLPLMAKVKDQNIPGDVAIPSNRVNVSYIKGDENANSVRNLSQSPQIGSMFPTKMCTDRWKVRPIKSRNPLKSGQCFLQSGKKKKRIISFGAGRNPLKSGQCFLPLMAKVKDQNIPGDVAIPSNRVNVSYSTHLFLRIIGNLTPLLREPHYFYAFFFPI